MNFVRLVVVTGLSGSGKTAALKSLEDLGFFCIDNLPVELFPKLGQLSVFSREMVSKVAIGMDSREPTFLESFKEAFEELESLGITAEVIFLEASDDVLLKRFSQTRRRHPLAGGRSVPEAIHEERRLLEEIKRRAALVLDTSEMNVHQLKRTLWDYFESGGEGRTMQVTLMSFGFSHGLPRETDMLFDVRFLTNPYFNPELRDKTGLDPKVAGFVFSDPASEELLDRLAGLIAFLLPKYDAEGKSYLTVSLGCTGGKHRSVAVVEELSKRLAGERQPIKVMHRDIQK